MNEFVEKIKADAAQEIETGIGIGKKKGKGGLTDLTHGRTDVLRLNPYTVQIEDGWNIRNPQKPHNIENMKSLASQIVAQGQIQPILVVFDKLSGKILVRDGHTRLLAIRYANEHLGAQIEHVLARTSGVAEDGLTQMLKTLASPGFEPTMLERAEMVRRIMRVHGIPANEVAKRLGFSTTRVNTWLEWESLLTPKLRQLVEDDVVTLSMVVRTIKSLASREEAEAHIVAAVEAQKVEAEDGLQASGGTAPRAAPQVKVRAKDVRKAISANGPATLKEVVASIFGLGSEHEVGAEFVTLKISRATFDILRVHAGRVSPRG